jgi:TnsA-like endonuclease N terminal
LEKQDGRKVKGNRSMALKRKPPGGNVRRVASIAGNLRYTITSKADQTVQCESFLERKLTLCFDRDPSIRSYTSQPERLTYVDTEGKSHTYIPDFMVWKTSGEIELHEVTLTSRADDKHIQERAAAARSVCKERGWRYIVHTEATLPQAAAEANLLALARYRPTAYAHPEVTHFVQQRLTNEPSPVLFHALLTQTTHALQLQEAPVVSDLCHLLWHGKLETDLCHHLIFQEATPRANLLVWLPKEREAR